MALIPPFFIDSVVAIGTDDPQGKRKRKRIWIASGFLYGRYLPKMEDGKKGYKVYLVTNRHVFERLTKAYVRCNPQASEPAREYPLNLVNKDGFPLWMANPDAKVDVAVIPINFNLLKEQGMQVDYFQSDIHVATIEKMNELGITEGDSAYVLGFPMGLLGGQRNSVIVRNGSIARLRDALTKDNQTFLVDAFVFPGNSGGPVVLKPEAFSIEGTKSQNSAYLIGIVQSYVPYQDVAVSIQTNSPRVIFEENSGLAAVHPVDFIEEAIQNHLKTQTDKEESTKT